MKSARIAWLAGALAFLTAAGAGIAVAATTDPLGLNVDASAATPGVTQTNSLSALNFTYDQSTSAYATAGAVTLQNTGTREADYSLSLTPHDATVPGLPTEISVAVGSVASTGACTASATLTNAQTGTLSSAFTYSSSAIPLKLAAGASVVLCVQTTFNSTVVTSYGSTSVAIDVAGTVTYAAGVSWSVSGATATVTQQVLTTDIVNLFNGAGRFYFYSAYDAAAFGSTTPSITTVGAYCTAWGSTPLRFGMTTNTGCLGYNEQIRLVQSAASPTEFMLLQNTNTWDQGTTIRWEYTNLTTDVLMAAPATDTTYQRWVIQGRGDGTYRIVVASTASTATPLCLQYTDLNINPNSVGGSGAPGGYKQIRAAACVTNAAGTHDTLAYRRQGFRFDLIGTPLPPAGTYPNGYTATCTVNNGNTYAQSAWPVADQYQGEARYRMMWTYSGTTTGGAPFTVPAQQVGTQTNGYDTQVQLYNSDAALEAFWTYLQNYLSTNGLPATGSAVAVTMTIEQQITNADIFRTVTAPITMGIQHQATNNNKIFCGVPPAATPTPTPTDTTPSGPLNFPSSWCTPGEGGYLQLHFPYASGETWKVFFWKTGDAAINPGNNTNRVMTDSEWMSGGEQYLSLKFTGGNSVDTWVTAHGGGTQTGVEVRIYRSLGGGSWEYYAMRPMTFRSSWPQMTCT